MRKVFFAALYLISLAVAAKDQRLRIRMDAFYARNFASHTGSSTDFGLSQMHNGWGGNLVISKIFYNGWGGGISLSTNIGRINQEAVRTQILQQYGAADYFTTVDNLSNSCAISQIGMEIFKEFYFTHFRISPFIRLGLGNVNNFSDIHIHHKKKNENYFIDYQLKPQDNSDFDFFYPSAGVNLDVPVASWLAVHTGITFSYGQVRTSITEYYTDLLGASGSSQQHITQNFSSLQAGAGILFYLGRKK